MREKPFQLVKALAVKIQRVALGTAQKASVVAQAAEAKAARITNGARAHAAEKARIRAIRAANKPGIRFLRDVTHGRMRFSFYRSIDNRGNVRDFWTLSRETGRGVQRLATGSMAEFRDIRAMALQPLRQGQSGGQRPRGPRREGPAPTQPVTRGRAVSQKKLSGIRPERGPKERWYTLVYIETSANGTAKTRAVRNYNDLKSALDQAKQNPKLAVYRHPSQRPREQGRPITTSTRNLIQPRPRENRQGTANGKVANSQTQAQAKARQHELVLRLRQQQSPGR